MAARGAATSLTGALLDYLTATDSGDVYGEPSAFEAFISNGTNPPLYEATIEHLKTTHLEDSPVSVLDIGCGDGRVTAASIASPASVDLVEPSQVMLATATAAVSAPGRDVWAHPLGIEAFLAGPGESGRWGLVQTTFAIHNTKPAERLAVLGSLAQRTDHLVIVEFDAPDPEGDGYVQYLAERYEDGVREYVDHPEVVTGFLMPVLVGQLQPGRLRHTYEQPINAWCHQLNAAGFACTATVPLFDYWWAPAFAIHARH